MFWRPSLSTRHWHVWCSVCFSFHWSSTALVNVEALLCHIKHADCSTAISCFRLTVSLEYIHTDLFLMYQVCVVCLWLSALVFVYPCSVTDVWCVIIRENLEIRDWQDSMGETAVKGDRVHVWVHVQQIFFTRLVIGPITFVGKLHLSLLRKPHFCLRLFWPCLKALRWITRNSKEL